MCGKGKLIIVWLLMGMLVLGFGGFGVINFLGGSGVDIGVVGDVEISVLEYVCVLCSEMQDFIVCIGCQLLFDEVCIIGIDQMVMLCLFIVVVFEDEVNWFGILVGDKVVGEQIVSFLVFVGLDGKFDRVCYVDMLNCEGICELQFEYDLCMDEVCMIL